MASAARWPTSANPAKRSRPSAGASKRGPGYAAAHRELGRLLLDGGQPEAAREAFEAGIAAAEESGDLQTAREMETFLRRAQRALGETPAAKPAAPAAAPPPPVAEVDPDARREARAHYKRGFEHYARGENAEAIDAYRMAIREDPYLSIVWNALSLALAARGELDEAVAAAKRLIELEPDDALSHTNLSRLLVQQGKIPEAEDARAVAMRLQMKAAGRTQ